MSGNAPDDHEFEQLLAAGANVARRYRAASQDEPPAALDEIIRAAARRQAGARPRLAGSQLMASWRVPLSIAAVVVVSATITLMVAERDGRVPFARTTPAPATATGAARNQAEPPPAPAQALESPAGGAKAESKARREAARSLSSSEGAVGRRFESNERSTPLSTQSSQRETFPSAAEPGAELPAPAGLPGAPAGPTAQQTPAPTAGPAGPPLASSRTATLRDLAREQERGAAPSGALPQDEQSVGDAPAAKAAPVAPMHQLRGAYQPTPRAEDLQAQASAKRQAQPVQNSESDASPWEKDPQAWLAHIDELRATGRSADARASFLGFRSRYPDYRLPPSFVIPAP